MATTYDTAAFDQGTDVVLRFFTTEQAKALVAYRGDEAIQSRIEELAAKSTEGELTEQERAEYEGYVRANKFIALLQLKAQAVGSVIIGMDAATRNLVRQRAGNRCEYCGLAQEQSPLASLHIEHIVPVKHGGTDDAENLAAACIDCNLHKGSNIAGYDPQTGAITQLFHPRRHKWDEHFRREGAIIVGLTAVGRTTVEVLRMNCEEQVQLRMVSGG